MVNVAPFVAPFAPFKDGTLPQTSPDLPQLRFLALEPAPGLKMGYGEYVLRKHVPGTYTYQEPLLL